MAENTTNWDEILSLPCCKDLKAWVLQNICPSLGKAPCETPDELKYVHDSIQTKIAQFNNQVTLILNNPSLDPRIRLALNSVTQPGVIENSTYCVDLFYALRRYCEASVNSPPETSNPLEQNPSVEGSMENTDSSPWESWLTFSDDGTLISSPDEPDFFPENLVSSLEAGSSLTISTPADVQNDLAASSSMNPGAPVAVQQNISLATQQRQMCEYTQIGGYPALEENCTPTTTFVQTSVQLPGYIQTAPFSVAPAADFTQTEALHPSVYTQLEDFSTFSTPMHSQAQAAPVGTPAQTFFQGSPGATSAPVYTCTSAASFYNYTELSSNQQSETVMHEQRAQYQTLTPTSGSMFTYPAQVHPFTTQPAPVPEPVPILHKQHESNSIQSQVSPGPMQALTHSPNSVSFSGQYVSSRSMQFQAEESNFTRLKSEVQSAAKLLAEWKENELWKERDYSRINPDIDEMHLFRVQEIHDRVFQSISALNNEERQEILRAMIPNLLVIIKQPTYQNEGRVLIKKFEAAVRLLVSKSLRKSKDKYRVKTEIIDQSHQPVKLKNSKPFVLSKNVSELRDQDRSNTLVAEFSCSFSKPPKRMDLSNYQEVKTVLSENFWVRFQVDLLFDNYTEQITASAISLPVKIAVNISQCSQAWETIIWDNAARNYEVKPISSRPVSLPYLDVQRTINTRIYYYTGRALHDADFTVIAKKLFGEDFFDGAGDTFITFKQFEEKKIMNDLELDDQDDQSVSLWTWFFYLSKFIKDHLQLDSRKRKSVDGVLPSLWTDGKIAGCISTQRTQEILLSGCFAAGTFLLRFSTSTPNAITVDWLDEDGMVYSYRATGRYLKLRCLPDAIMDISKWKFLYSLFSNTNIPKEDAFKKTKFPILTASQYQYQPDSGTGTSPTTAMRYVRALLQLQLLSFKSRSDKPCSSTKN